MKKYFLLATLAFTTIALVSCGDKKKDEPTPDPQPTVQAKIELDANEVTMAYGSSIELVAVIVPANNATITWTSTDANIATVDEFGTVTGVGLGTAKIIASAQNVIPDTCVVNVVDPMTLFQWAGYQFWGFKDADPSTEEDDFVFTGSDTLDVPLTTGDTVHCVLAESKFVVWSQGIEMLISQGYYQLTGAGYLAYVDGASYVIIDQGPMYGYYVNTGLLKIVDPAQYDPTKSSNANTAPAAKLIDPAKHYAYLTDTTATEEGITGACIDVVDFNAGKAAYYVGFFGPSIFQNRGDFLYASNVAWFSTWSYYGLALNDAGTDFKQPYEFAAYKPYYYTNVQSGAPAMKAPAAKASVVSVENVEGAALRSPLQKYGKVRSHKTVNAAQF
jgi:hypothetical protein